jgi:single-stranded-DNA-specific exonuclease
MPDDLLARTAALVRSARVVCPHNDADGLAAAAIALRERGESADAALLLPRGQNPFGADFKPPKGSGAVAVLDQGVRDVPYAAVFVDHHAPDVPPDRFQTPNRTVFSGFGEESVSTAILMARLFPDERHRWLAAVGAAGDYGDAGLKQPECVGVVKSHVKKLVPLVNAPRRLPGQEAVRTALSLLIDHENPKTALADKRISILEAAKAQWRAAFETEVKTAPKVVGNVALIRFSSECQVKPLVAQTWMSRLAPKAVIAANVDYVPGMVNFACRGGPAGRDLRDLLKQALPDAVRPGVEFAHGHPQATGGSLTEDDFERLLRALGF